MSALEAYVGSAINTGTISQRTCYISSTPLPQLETSKINTSCATFPTNQSHCNPNVGLKAIIKHCYYSAPHKTRRYMKATDLQSTTICEEYILCSGQCWPGLRGVFMWLADSGRVTDCKSGYCSWSNPPPQHSCPQPWYTQCLRWCPVIRTRPDLPCTRKTQTKTPNMIQQHIHFWIYSRLNAGHLANSC